MEERLRLKVEGVRGSADCARFMEDRLNTIPGIQEVTANPSTGSVLIRYEPRVEIGHAVREGVRAANVAPGGQAASSGASSRVTLAVRIAEMVGVVLLELALQRALGPFFPRRSC